MASHDSALKKIRQDVKKTTRNRWWKSRVKTASKVVLDFCANNKKTDAETAFKAANKEISKAQSKGIFHKNTAARKVSALAKAVSKLS